MMAKSIDRMLYGVEEIILFGFFLSTCGSRAGRLHAKGIVTFCKVDRLTGEVDRLGLKVDKLIQEVDRLLDEPDR